jgi:hypothetical protein
METQPHDRPAYYVEQTDSSCNHRRQRSCLREHGLGGARGSGSG